jgi:NADH-quinone oxidoreductase subunit M
MKRLIAYSILGNLSFCTLGIFCFAIAGLDGAVYQTINEGLTGSALLILVSLLYERYGTYDIALYGGVATRLPMLATLFVITTLALIGLPLFNGFVGEFLVLSGSFASHPLWVGSAAIGVILSATYMLWMVQRIFYRKESSLVVNRPAPDLLAREHLTLWPMAVLMLAMGVLSPYWMRGIESGVTQFPSGVSQSGAVGGEVRGVIVSRGMASAHAPASVPLQGGAR